jgi:Ca-activated chloride channel family protein
MWDKLKHTITSIQWDQFHFLRPAMLYLFIPLAIIVVILIIGNGDGKKWRAVIHPVLRPYMFTRGSSWAILLPLMLFIIGTGFSILALAGPTWKKKELPGEKIQAVVLIALDLSRSMLANDIEPNRLERAKFKISDLLDANPRARAGLVAFAGSAHPVLPFTSDYKLVKHHAASLVNRIIPVQGTNIPVLLSLVDTMLQKIEAPGTIVLMTDEIDANDAVLLENYIQGTRHRMEILLFSTPMGAKVPGHPQVLSKQDPAVIANLAQDTAITITPLTLDKSDVQGIAARISKKLVFEKDNKKNEKEWDDMGLLFLLPVLPIALFWFRKGWVIQWCWAGLLLTGLSACGINSKHPDWWYSKDYQGQLLENAGRYEEAAERFENDDHRAVAYFKAGNFEAAADLFAMDSSASASYNRGLALAKLGRYDEAMNAFGKAISLDPSLQTKVNSSIQQTAAAKERADSILKYDPASVSDKIKALSSNKNKEKKDPLKEHKPEGKDEKLSSDTRVKKLPKFGNRATDETTSNIHRGKEAKTPPKDFQQQKPGQSSEQILTQQVQHDPSEFLHRRFELQVKKYYKDIPKSKNSW